MVNTTNADAVWPDRCRCYRTYPTSFSQKIRLATLIAASFLCEICYACGSRACCVKFSMLVAAEPVLSAIANLFFLNLLYLQWMKFISCPKLLHLLCMRVCVSIFYPARFSFFFQTFFFSLPIIACLTALHASFVCPPFCFFHSTQVYAFSSPPSFPTSVETIPL